MNEVRDARDAFERYPAWTVTGGQFVLSTDTTYAVVTPVEDVDRQRIDFELELTRGDTVSPLTSLTYDDHIEWQFETAEAFAHAAT